MTLQVGDRALDFTLPNQEAKMITLSDYRGQWILVYFYPRDNTAGCAKEACAFQDKSRTFRKRNIVIFGISSDSPVSHKKFAQKYNLRFDLLSDEKKEVLKSYGVWGKKKIMGKEYRGIMRSSVLIDPQGNIAKVYSKVKPDQHAQEVLEDYSLIAKI